MKIPKGMTEKEVLDSIDRVANGLARKYQFGYYSIDDMKQEARLEALDGLERYDPSKGKLETFLWCHVSNRLFNLKRNKFERLDKPCFKCPLNAYDPNKEKSNSQCTAYDDKMSCELYESWYIRNSSKKNIVSPICLMNVRDEHEDNMKLESNIEEIIDYNDLVNIIEEKLPINLRKYWIRLKNDIKLTKSEQNKLISCIKEIIREEGYNV